MKVFGVVLGAIVALLCVAAALYLGIWILAVGGITEGIKAVQAHPLNGQNLAVGIVKVILFPEVTPLLVWLGIILGGALGFTLSSRK